MHRLLLVALGLVVLLPASPAEESPKLPVTLTLRAGDQPGSSGPLSIPVAADEAKRLEEEALSVSLASSDATFIPAQLIKGASPRLTWIPEAPLKPGEKRTYHLRTGKPSTDEAEDPVMRCVVTDEALTLLAGDRVVLSYRKRPTDLEDEFDPAYTRTGYIHPLLTPSGRCITGDYPVDHPHQHALFQAWTKTRFQGRPINFWDQAKGKGIIRYLDTLDSFSGPVCAGFTVRQSHEDATDPDASLPVLEETWTVRAYAIDASRFLVDIESRQVCASDDPLIIETYHYGGMAIRGNAQWFDPDKEATPPGSFLTSDGLGRKDGNHSRPNWVSMHGMLDGRNAGVAILSHPDNFRSPQWVRLHPTKPYFVFTPQVEEGFRIEPGQPFVGRYRYLVYDGAPEDAKLEDAWQSYAHPPTIIATDF